MSDDEKRAVGRPRKAAADKIDAEQVRVPLPAGGKARITSALEPGESMSSFIRAAIDAEIARRHRLADTNGSRLLGNACACS